MRDMDKLKAMESCCLCLQCLGSSNPLLLQPCHKYQGLSGISPRILAFSSSKYITNGAEMQLEFLGGLLQLKLNIFGCVLNQLSSTKRSSVHLKSREVAGNKSLGNISVQNEVCFSIFATKHRNKGS